MRWASALATTARLEDAVEEAAETLAASLGSAPDLLLAFASSEYADHYSRLAPALLGHFGSSLVVGCSAGGVIGGGHEVEREPALALVGATLPGVDLVPFHLDGDPQHWPEQVGVDAADEPSFLLFPDPFTCPAEEMIDWLDLAYPGSVVLGGLASGGFQPGGTALFIDDDIHRSGAVGLALCGNIEIETVVAQGCRPVGAPMFVTRCEDNVLLELDGEPAIAALERVHATLPDRDKDLFRHSLFLGLVMEEKREVYTHGDFLVRNLVGIDPERSALVVASPLGEQQVVQFHLRDADASAADLRAVLSMCDTAEPAGALMFSCLGRGVMLYGQPDHDTEVFAEQVGEDVPLGGFFCNGEIGPIGGRTYLHGYTSSVGLIRPRR